MKDFHGLWCCTQGIINVNSTKEVKDPEDYPEIYLISAGRNAKLFRGMHLMRLNDPALPHSSELK